MFLLEPIGLFVQGKKMTLETGGYICYWAHHHLARQYYHDHKLLSFEQFNSVDWKSIHHTLHNLLQLFQLWTAKHVLGIKGTTKFLAHQYDRSPLCPGCLMCKESCMHIAWRPEKGRPAAFVQLTQGVEAWLDRNHTHPELKQLLLHYLRGRGTITCLKCLVDLNLPHILQEFAVLQDVIGWDGFAMGMVSTKLLPIQSAYFYSSRSSSNAMQWIYGLITQLLKVTHTQWLYQCMLLHDRMAGTIISAHKEELLKNIKHQLTIGPEGLDKEDRFLIKCNFDELATTTGKH